jgi:hypothetical protein
VRLKELTSLAPIPLYKGFLGNEVRLTQKITTTTTSMVAASVLQQHIQTMAVERQRPTMTLMVIASAPAAVGNVIEFVS